MRAVAIDKKRKVAMIEWRCNNASTPFDRRDCTPPSRYQAVLQEDPAPFAMQHLRHCVQTQQQIGVLRRHWCVSHFNNDAKQSNRSVDVGSLRKTNEGAGYPCAKQATPKWCSCVINRPQEGAMNIAIRRILKHLQVAQSGCRENHLKACKT